MDLFDYEVMGYWRDMDEDYEWCDICGKIMPVGHAHVIISEEVEED